MPIKQLQLQCARCNEITPHNQTTPNHVVHALVSLFLVGLWIPIWILIAMGSSKEPAACVKCGNRRLPLGEATIFQPTKEWSLRTRMIFLGVIVVAVAAMAIVAAVQ